MAHKSHKRLARRGKEPPTHWIWTLLRAGHGRCGYTWSEASALRYVAALHPDWMYAVQRLSDGCSVSSWSPR